MLVHQLWVLLLQIASEFVLELRSTALHGLIPKYERTAWSCGQLDHRRDKLVYVGQYRPQRI